VLELPDGPALRDDLVNAVKGGGEHPQKKAEQDNDPEVDIRTFQLEEIEVQLDFDDPVEHLQVFDDEDDTQENNGSSEDYFNETHVGSSSGKARNCGARRS